MRLGVLDVGSNTVHFLVVDAHQGGRPLPVFSHKAELHLGDSLENGKLSRSVAVRLRGFVTEALQIAEDKGVEELLAFATSAVRDASNGDNVLASVKSATGVDITVLPGPEEARLTFLAVRRWFGWSSGKVLMLDIGGGSLELASGIDEEPDTALSVPLGAGRLTRERLHGDPPRSSDIDALIDYVDKLLDKPAKTLTAAGWDRPVATSKTFRTLARLSGAAPSAEGPLVHRMLTLTGLHQVRGFIQHIPSSKLAEMDGVSASRAHQLLAGAIVAEATMRRLGIDAVEFCPWALREGVILRRLDILES